MNIHSNMKVIMVGIENPHMFVLELAASMNAVSFFSVDHCTHARESVREREGCCFSFLKTQF